MKIQAANLRKGYDKSLFSRNTKKKAGGYLLRGDLDKIVQHVTKV